MDPSDGASTLIAEHRVKLRPADSTDNAFVALVFESTVEAKFAGLKLDPQLKRSLIELQFRAFLRSREQEFPHARRRLALVDGRPAGYLSTDVNDGRTRIEILRCCPAFVIAVWARL
jgi:hypothetical protein